MSPELKTRCGYVALLGIPNAGKSTLMNQLIGSKVAIVSPKVQTTRQCILGIMTQGHTQIIFMDTPGLFTPKRSLEKSMVKAAWGSIQEADIISFLVDVTSPLSAALEIYQKLTQRTPVILLLNKIDALTNKTELLNISQAFQDIAPAKETFMLSACKGSGVQDFILYVQEQLPFSPWLFDPEQTTNLPLRLWASEITREQLYLQLYEELPYDAWVESEKWEEFQNGSVKIHQKIIVSKEGQKGIILGHKGQKIKSINQAARKIMEEELGHQVHLFLHVSVDTKWQEKNSFYRETGLKYVK